MTVLVLGSGVIGTTLAWYLARAGESVTVVDRQPGSGLETSFANAGEISPGYASPWAGPGVPAKALKWLLMQHAPLIIKPMLDGAMWRWGLAMLANCTEARYRVNKGRMVRLAEYSRDCMKALRAETAIEYDGRERGTLQVFRTNQQLDGIAKDIAILEHYRVPYQVFDRAGFLKYEPGLARSASKFVGALRLPGDETGDCHLFTQRLGKLAEARGAVFRYGVNITRLVREGARIVAVETDQGTLTADRIVVALGSHSPTWLDPVGVRIPVYPVKGYSITVPVLDAAQAPESTIMDETHKIAVTRLGDRIRVGGMAQLSGYDLSLAERRRHTLEFVLEDLFPDGGDLARTTFWTGLRPMTPDGTPVIGATAITNLYLATGHGTLGWTMAAGTGKAMADLLTGVKPEIDFDGLTIERYARG
ncbi:MAG TPA: D-amino acid dehydrogenase [Burkholderiaceae bacterium]|jgi:D-amino-acid dehydrogenase|nr:D-amino acid dehydrogenase [Burkholderiaceae bacterium]